MLTIRNEITHLHKLLKQHMTNVHYLEERAAGFGAMNVPLDLQNQLQAEREAVNMLQEALSELKKKHPTAFRGAGRRLVPFAETESLPGVLVIESDPHWRDIYIEVITAFVHKAASLHPRELIEHPTAFSPANYRIAIIGIPSLQLVAAPQALETWSRQVGRIGEAMPVILLTTKETTDLSLVTRHALRQHHTDSIATIPKETFNYGWFIKMVKKALTLKNSYP